MSNNCPGCGQGIEEPELEDGQTPGPSDKITCPQCNETWQWQNWQECRQLMIDYLEKCLIPDLRESGQDATADDFERCMMIMESG
jgi:hypothetical protein